MKLDKENKLTENELEQVTGGGDAMANDSRFLNVLLRGRRWQCGRYGSLMVGQHSEEIVRAWASVRVEYYIDESPFGNSEIYHYKINGKEVSQYDAWLHAEQVVGKHLKRADWDW